MPDKTRGNSKAMAEMPSPCENYGPTMTSPIPAIPVSGGAVRSPRGPSYLLGKRLGSGAFGAVFDCIGPFDQSFALKVFLPGNRPYEEVRDALRADAVERIVLCALLTEPRSRTRTAMSACSSR